MKEEITLTINAERIIAVSQRDPISATMVTSSDVTAIIEKINLSKMTLIQSVISLAIDSAIKDYLAEHTHEPDHEQDISNTDEEPTH